MRLTIGPAALAVVFAAIVGALVLRNVLEAGRRPLGWALAAVVAAAALEPVVALASRQMRRGVALVVTVVPLLALVGLVTWASVRDLDAQVQVLQRDIPDVAQQIQDSERFGDAATEFALVDKAEAFAGDLRRPSSRVGEEARGGASTWALTLILTLFALGWGPRFSEAAQRQVRDRRRRDQITRVVGRAFDHSQVYVDVAVLLALAAGLLAWVAFTLIDLPAPTPLALLVGVASLVPSLGIAVATVPVAVLGGSVVSPGTGVALLVGGDRGAGPAPAGAQPPHPGRDAPRGGRHRHLLPPRLRALRRGRRGGRRGRGRVRGRAPRRRRRGGEGRHPAHRDAVPLDLTGAP